ncbi:MAG TPA: SRPBCC family protein [Longimicrobium sp.]|nr:SRPBCC family protein [Longimicrobium sp.]
MAEYIVTMSREIDAPAEKVYGIVADYVNGHPRILPPKYFTGLQVEKGGVGDGTIIRFGMKVMGKEYITRAAVTEPEPGRVLVETDLEGYVTTTFTTDPIGAGRSRMTFSTRGRTRAGGILGALEKWFAVRFLPRVYTDELALLAAEATR